MPLMESVVAPETDQDSVELAPEVIVAGFAENDEIAGGCVFRTVTETGAEVVELFDVSVATAARVWPPSATEVVFQEKAHAPDVIGAPSGPPSSRNWTLATATLSAAFAVTETSPDTVDPAAGAVIDTVGGVVSA
jgi:hypothetical protein